MNRYIVAICGLCLALATPGWGAEQNCSAAKELPLKWMGKELTRSFKNLKKQQPPMYYLSYTYTVGEESNLRVSLGGAVRQKQHAVSYADVQVRAGSPHLDNTRALKGEWQDFHLDGYGNVPNLSDTDTKAFRLSWWRATQTAVEEVQKAYARVAANVRTMSETKDRSDDFTFPPVETYCRTEVWPEIDLEAVKTLLVKAAKLAEGKSYVLDSSFDFSIQRGHRYFADSQGTRLKTPYSLVRLSYTLNNCTKDGVELSRFNNYNVFSSDQLPSEEQLLADVTKSLSELEMLSTAEEGKPFTAPAILKGRAAGVFVHEVLGHRLEGHRQKDDSEGQTFTGKVGQQIISDLLTITDDPTLREFNGTVLRGYYEYDDEGVKARPVTLIENGVLKNFLMSSSPIEGFNLSNGHGRRQRGFRAVARMGIMRTTASHTVSYDTLEHMLLEEINRQGKPYGFIVEDLEGGVTLTSTYLPQSFKLRAQLIYKVYPDGRKEPVRGLDVVGTPLVSFNQVLAAADDDSVFDGTCGAESGWVPQTNIAPSLLLKSLETQKTHKGDFKPPVLPSPLIKKERKK